MIGHLPVVPLILMIDAMSVVKRDIMLMTVIAIADEEEAGHDLDPIPDPGEGDTLKPFNPREVVARVRAVLRRVGSTTLPSKVLRSGELALDLDGHSLMLNERSIEVTPTEFELLKAFMEQPAHAYSRAELIERALGYDYAGGERTLDSHIKNLRKKIECDPTRPVYILTVYGVGYRWGLRE